MIFFRNVSHRSEILGSQIGGVDSAKSKLARARKHLKAIKRATSHYARSHPHVLTKAKGKKTTRLTIPRVPPREITILAGEMVYQMRSALDHLVFDLVKRNPKVSSIDPDWSKNCQFPIRIKRLKAGQNPPLLQRQFAQDLPGVTGIPFAFIESLQPYYGVGAVNNALRFLAELSNIDKHKYMNVVGSRVRAYHDITFASGFRSTGHEALDHGAEIPADRGWTEFDLPVKMHRSFRPFVNFKEKDILGDAITLPVDYLLQLILEQIETIIVPAFEKFVKKL
jgi:hypothetical protein